MGRTSEGWQFRPQRKPTHVRCIRFWVDGVEYEKSTGKVDLAEATAAADRIYERTCAEHRARPPEQRRSVSDDEADELAERVAEWIESLLKVLDPKTVKSYGDYAGLWVPFFKSIDNITEKTCAAYIEMRLGKVLAKTVRKECSSIRRFISWCQLKGLGLGNVVVPSIPRDATGTKSEKRTRVKAFGVSPDEITKLIGSLDDWSTSKRVGPFPIRGRFEFMYATGLRVELIDQLSVPEHWEPGQDFLNITKELDKERDDREVPLFPEALAALERVWRERRKRALAVRALPRDERPGWVHREGLPDPDSGLVFGKHRFIEHIREAAHAALKPHRAKQFAPTHTRSVALTHLCERTSNHLAVQQMAGHKYLSTTSLYAKPSARAVRNLITELTPPKRKRGKSA